MDVQNVRAGLMDGSSATRKKWGMAMAGMMGGIGLGLAVLAVPFLLPARRKYCLPYVPATKIQMHHVLQQLKGKAGKVVDLGSGDGRVVIAAAMEGHYAVGYELNPWLVLYSRWKALVNGVHKTTKFYRKDFWKVNLSQYDKIVVFGVQEMMEELEKKIESETSPNTRVISCRFRFPNWQPSLSLNHLGPHSLWVYDRVGLLKT